MQVQCSLLYRYTTQEEQQELHLVGQAFAVASICFYCLISNVAVLANGNYSFLFYWKRIFHQLVEADRCCVILDLQDGKYCLGTRCHQSLIIWISRFVLEAQARLDELAFSRFTFVCTSDGVKWNGFFFLIKFHSKHVIIKMNFQKGPSIETLHIIFLKIHQNLQSTSKSPVVQFVNYQQYRILDEVARWPAIRFLFLSSPTLLDLRFQVGKPTTLACSPSYFKPTQIESDSLSWIGLCWIQGFR